MEFRLLRADEIDARVSTVKQNGVSVLLYKDARCDMNILDETVGAMNWQRHHSRDNANCTVAIWDTEKGQWIEKEDTGTESNTEKEKGLASDSFKRACFNWGIGRELYTAPFIWIPESSCKIVPKGQGFTCFDRFEVEDIQYTGRRISYLRIANTSTKKTFEYGKEAAQEKTAAQKIGAVKAKALQGRLEGKVDIEKLLAQYKVTRIEDLTENDHADILRRLSK